MDYIVGLVGLHIDIMAGLSQSVHLGNCKVVKFR